MQILLSFSLTVLMISFIVMLMMLLTNFLSKNYWSPWKKFSFWMWFWSNQIFTFTLSLQFFFIAIIFLIFYVDIALILPMTIILTGSNMKIRMFTSIMFLLILTIGLYHEWNQGSLEWAY